VLLFAQILRGLTYGGLFATYVLLTEPALFQRYIIVSPSLWYSERIAFTMEKAAAQSGIRPDARAFFAVGALENPTMADDLTELVQKLRSRNSVFPGAVTRGLLTVFDRPEPQPAATPQSGRGP
jgi:predicted alpha/beta superfamily hydrolase